MENLDDMRSRSVAAVLVLVLATLSAGPAAGSVSPRSPHLCADVTVPLRNFKVEAKWQKSTVSVGDTATMKVLVTRTAEEDPVTDEGHPYPTGRPMDEPAEDVVVGMSMLVGNVFLSSAGAVTNSEGEADVKIKIKNYTRPGIGNSRVYAELVHTPPGFPSPSCRVIVFEWGKLDPAPKLKVVR